MPHARAKPLTQQRLYGVLVGSIRDGQELLVPLEGSIRNMAVIEAIFRSAEAGGWVNVKR